MSLLQPPAPDFSDPLGLLAACHQRMLGFCGLLERLGPWLESHPLDNDVRQGIQRVIHYFGTAGEHHHRDEEQDLFPLLDSDEALAPLLARLRAEHREQEHLWQALAGQLHPLLRGKCDLPALDAAIAPFCAAYRRHIEQEERHVLSAATARLTVAQLQQLGRSMASRRGIAPPSRTQ